MSTGRRIFDGIAQDIEQHILEFQLVHSNIFIRRNCKLIRKHLVLLLHFTLQRYQQHFEKRLRMDYRRRKHKFAPLDAGQAQRIVDEIQQKRPGFLDFLQVILLLRRLRRPDSQFTVAQDTGQRRAQIMAEVIEAFA